MFDRIRNAIARTVDAIAGRRASAEAAGASVGGEVLAESDRPKWSGWWPRTGTAVALAAAGALGRPAPGVYATHEPDVWATWTIDGIRQALIDHERGQFRTAAILADQLLRDDRIFATLNSLVLGALGLPFSTRPSDATTNQRKALELAKQVDAWWFRMIPESTHGEILRWYALMGFVVAEVYWDTTTVIGEWRPRLRVHHPQFISYDFREQAFFVEVAGEIGPDGERVVSGTSRVRVTPGDGRWLLFGSSGERPWMNGAVRPVAFLFLVRTLATRDWVRRSEVTGIGIRKAMVPNGADEKVVAKFLKAVQKLGVETTLRLPEGFNFQIEAVDGKATELFEKLIGRCDMGITLALLGQNMTTQAGMSGNQGAAQVHARVQLDRLEAIVEGLATTLREHVLIPWGRFNVANWEQDWAPWPHWDTRPPADRKVEAETLNTLAQALKGLEEQRVDTDVVLERFDLKRREAGVKSPVPPVATPPANEPPPDEGDNLEEHAAVAA